MGKFNSRFNFIQYCLATVLLVILLTSCNSGGSCTGCNSSGGGTNPVAESINWNVASVYVYPSQNESAVLTLNGESSANPTITITAEQPTTGTITISTNGSFGTSASCLLNSSSSCTVVIRADNLVPRGTIINLIASSSDGTPIAKLPVAVGVYAYLTGYGGAGVGATMFYCSITNNGSFESCTNANNSSTFSASTRISFSESFAYVANSGNQTISYCPPQESPAFGPCSVITESTVFYDPLSIVFRGESRGYITNGAESNNVGGNVAFCHVQESGSFESCTALNDPAFRLNGGFPTDIKLHGDFAYITVSWSMNQESRSGGNTVASCQILESGGFKQPCTAIQDPSFSAPNGIAFYKNTAYIVNESNSTVSSCQAQTDGNLATCKVIEDPSFQNQNPSSITILGNIAYITNFGYIYGSTVSYCTVEESGSFGICNTINIPTQFSAPTSIAFY